MTSEAALFISIALVIVGCDAVKAYREVSNKQCMLESKLNIEDKKGENNE